MSPSATVTSPIASTTSTAAMETTDSEPPAANPVMIHLSSHPVVLHKITNLRSSETPPGTFRSLLKQVTYHLGHEATASLTVNTGLPIQAPLGKESTPDQEDLRCSSTVGVRLKDRVALVPILRSGLGMTDAMLELLPNSAVHHIGMYRERNSQGGGVFDNQPPVQYFNRLPRGKCGSDIAFVLDPMVGSAATVMAVVSILKKWGVPKIHIVAIVASRAGLELLSKKHPDVSVTVGMVDDHLTDCGIVLPGLGDVGDRLFGTGNHDFVDNHQYQQQHAEPPPSSSTTTTTTTTTDAAGNVASSAAPEDSGWRRKRSASLELEMEHTAKK